MPAVEIPMEAMVFPLGTYVQLDDGTSFGQFSYGKEGTIKIEDAGTIQGEDGKEEPVYKIEFNLTSKDGFTLKARTPESFRSPTHPTTSPTTTAPRRSSATMTWICRRSKRRITIPPTKSISRASATSRSAPTTAACNSSISVSNR